MNFEETDKIFREKLLKKENDANGPRSCPVSSRLSFSEALDKAGNQIDLDGIAKLDREFAKEIVNIIAEAYMMYDDAPIRIAGEYLDGYIVKQIFEHLTYEHVQLVIDNYKKVNRNISCKKAYIRTALYNSAFELEAHFVNEVQTDLG